MSLAFLGFTDFIEQYINKVGSDWRSLADVTQLLITKMKDELPDDILKLVDSDHITNTYHPEKTENFDVLTKDMIEKLISTLMVGGTGLKPEIEQAIFNRETERAQFANQEAKDKQTSDWAESKGFSLPDGVLTAMYAEIDKKYQDDRLATSRTIAIEQAQLEQRNILAAIERGIIFLTDVIKGATQTATSFMAAQTTIMNETARFLAEMPRVEVSFWGQLLSSLLNTVNLAGHYNAQDSASKQDSAELQTSVHTGLNTNYNYNFSG